MRKIKCHLQHNDAGIVVVIVLVMMMIMIIIIIIVTISIIDCAVPRSHDTYQFKSSWDLIRHISAAGILRFVRLIKLQQNYHVCHNSRCILKQKKNAACSNSRYIC
jgi:hypothetical protein